MHSQFRLPVNFDKLPDHDPGMNIWVVGGALRDHFLGRSYEDIDFTVDGDAIALARQVADDLKWHFYTLDAERGSARILPRAGDSAIRRMDFSRLRGGGIEEDLKNRDFTINALAIEVHEPSKLIDPTGGLSDLRSKQLRACSKDSLREDPVRVIRAVRFATALEFKIHPDTTAQLRSTVGGLENVSVERIRDEFFQILAGEHIGVAVRLMNHLQILAAVFERIGDYGDKVDKLEWQQDSAPIATADAIAFADLAKILRPEHDAEAAADAIWGSVSLRLGRFREKLSVHLDERISADRTRKSLIAFATLAIPFSGLVNQTEEAGLVMEPGSGEAAAAGTVSEYAREIRLSRAECDYIADLAGASRSLETAGQGGNLTDLDFHRYFRRFGDGGIGGALVYLSSAVSQSPGPPDADLWEQRLNVSRSLLEAYFERYDEVVDPDLLVDGSTLMDALEMQPGPALGELLDAIREASVTRRVASREEALEYARQLMREGGAG